MGLSGHFMYSPIQSTYHILILSSLTSGHLWAPPTSNPWIHFYSSPHPYLSYVSFFLKPKNSNARLLHSASLLGPFFYHWSQRVDSLRMEQVLSLPPYQVLSYHQYCEQKASVPPLPLLPSGLGSPAVENLYPPLVFKCWTLLLEETLLGGGAHEGWWSLESRVISSVVPKAFLTLHQARTSRKINHSQSEKVPHPTPAILGPHYQKSGMHNSGQ